VLRAIIGEYHPKAQPARQVHDRPPDVPAAYDHQRGASLNRFHEYLHLTSTDPDVAPFQVTE
jgi:hypothetical protein